MSPWEWTPQSTKICALEPSIGSDSRKQSPNPTRYILTRMFWPASALDGAGALGLRRGEGADGRLADELRDAFGRRFDAGLRAMVKTPCERRQNSPAPLRHADRKWRKPILRCSVGDNPVRL